MNRQQLRDVRKQKIGNIRHALNILDEAAEESSQEIRKIIDKDYHDLVKTFSNPENPGEEIVKNLSKNVNSAVDTSKKVLKELDMNVHRSPWGYLGGTALSSMALGFLIGKYSGKSGLTDYVSEKFH